MTSGVHGDQNRPITAIRPGANGDLTLNEDETSNDFVVWNDNRAGTYIPTPVPYKGSLWVVYDRGIFARYDAATGERLYRSRISDSNGHFTTSPWAYRDRIFATDEAGTTFVFGTGEEFEQLPRESAGRDVARVPGPGRRPAGHANAVEAVQHPGGVTDSQHSPSRKERLA